MEPLSLALAAGAFVAAELAKKTADAVITAAYKQIEAYVIGKLGRQTRVEDLDAEAMKASGLADDPMVAKFEAEVLARSPALRRAQLVNSTIRGAHVLWVDDIPANCSAECRLFRALGMKVQQVRSTSDVLQALGEGGWDLILSDMDRDGVPDAGIRMLKQLPSKSPPVIFYIGWVDQSRPVPHGCSASLTGRRRCFT